DDYVINGRKWWTSGAMSPRCELLIVMGVTDPDAERHRRQSMILVPKDTPGVEVVRSTSVFGYDDGPHGGHAEIVYDDVRVPAANRLGAEGGGFRPAPERSRASSRSPTGPTRSITWRSRAERRSPIASRSRSERGSALGGAGARALRPARPGTRAVGRRQRESGDRQAARDEEVGDVRERE